MIGSRELLYDINSVVVALGLLSAMLLAMALGYVFGRKRHNDANDEFRTQTTAVQGSLLGLLALLLGFTFSLALARHDARSEAVVAEANAVGTAWLRIGYLPPEAQDQAQDDLRRYMRLRVEASEITADQQVRRNRLVANAEAAFDDLWAAAMVAAQAQGGPGIVAYGNALNDMIDALGSRDATIERHVPEVVLLMMFATFILSGAMLGYGSGVAGAMPATPVYLMMTLIVLLVFMIIDLDRPRRGLIEVNQEPMRALLETMRAER